MATAADLIQQALETIKVKGEEQTSTTSAENTLGLKYLNDILDRWSVDNLAVYDLSLVSHTLTAGDGEYTIAASGADITSARPTEILGGYIRSNGVDYPLRRVELVEYDSHADKATRGLPEEVALDREASVARVYLWPTPDAAYTLYLRVRTAFTAFTASSNTVTYPPGYQAALTDALAVALCAPYGMDPPPWLLAQAERSYRLIKKGNRRVPRLVNDIGSAGRRYDIYSDQ